MAVINQNNNQVPPAPPTHHPPMRPNEGIRVAQAGPPRPMNPEYLVHQMGRLNVQPEKPPAVNNPKPKETTVVEDIDARAPFYYLGYTFFKADAVPGHKSTWNHVERTKMNLSQSDLMKLVHKRTKKIPIAEQYQSLSKVKRAHVDQLISELRKSDPHFEWTCVYVKEDEKPFKGKNSRRGDYETLSVNVVIMRKATDLVFPKIPVDDHVDVEALPNPQDRVPTHIHNDQSGQGPKGSSRSMQPSEPLVGPTIHQGPMPPAMNHSQQPLPTRFHQSPPHQPPPQLPQLPQGYPGPRPHMTQGPWPWVHGMPAGMHPHHAQPGMPVSTMPAPTMSGAAMSGQANVPHMVAQPNGLRGVHMAAGMFHHRQGFDPRAHFPGQQETHPSDKAPAPAPAPVPVPAPTTTPAPPETKAENVRPSTPAADPELELGLESSSVGDDESVFDFDDDSSITDSSDEEPELEDKPQPWRGSLYRRHSAPRAKHAYRTHYRKQPQKNGSDSKTSRSGYPNGIIDVVPADSKHVDPRSEGTVSAGGGGDSGPSQEVSRPARDRPKIIHAPVSTDELDLEQLLAERAERFRGGRARHDIRARILDDREARLEHRERMVEYRARALEERERLDEACYLGRRMSLREPGTFYGPRRYYLPEGLQ
ncbi:hypothetical protein AbraIFM66951_011709 [Aspergillus brasiliensis]|uniref:Uncharacterized protein n=1 Tax=Aspergillus brasiliensis TaxID=319629 RepID=A0A9W6DQ18_9EURO|nr:hypothetical protein AbraCBS73388_009679 [Aspergillus brasiliensis]GKZ41962.1 hypothetical protein AbraIFM66951_011709 [Aspergillus brasiliensis]